MTTTSMRIRAIGLFCVFVAGTAWGASAAETRPQNAEVLRILSDHSGQKLTSVFEARTHRGDRGVRYQADTSAAKSAPSGYCERVRVFAEIAQSTSAAVGWQVLEAEQAKAVAGPKDSVQPCETLPNSAFIAMPDEAALGEVALIMSAIDQIQPCSRDSDECKTQIVATPWGLLDDLVRAPSRPVVSLLVFDHNFSHGSLRVFNIEFTVEGSKRRYGADISIVDGRVTKIAVVEIVY